MEHIIYDQPCKRCNGVAGLDCEVCDGLGMTASFAAVEATMRNDPFAQAAAQGMSFRPGEAPPKAKRVVVRHSWPFTAEEPKAEAEPRAEPRAEPKAEPKAKPSRWPF